MIIEKIASLVNTFSPSNKKIASFVIKNKHDIGFDSVYDLSDKMGVSRASIVRFAKALGFSGFNEFKKAVQDELKSQLTPYNNVLFTDLDLLSKEKQLKKLVTNEITNLNKTLNQLDIITLMKIVEGMGKAEKIFVGGFGGNKLIAKQFVYSLQLITNKRIEAITGAISDFSRYLSSFSKNDVAFTITFPTYSKENFYLANYIKKNGGILFLITDSPECPLFNQADATLFCNKNSLTVANSFVGVVALIQIISDMYLLYCKEESLENIRNIIEIRHLEDP